MNLFIIALIVIVAILLFRTLNNIGDRIMSQISDYFAANATHLDRVAAALDDISGDIQNLDDTIQKLQNSPGTLTPEDQALLDTASTQSSALADKADGIAAFTPPVAPAAVIAASGTDTGLGTTLGADGLPVGGTLTDAITNVVAIAANPNIGVPDALGAAIDNLSATHDATTGTDAGAVAAANPIK